VGFIILCFSNTYGWFGNPDFSGLKKVQPAKLSRQTVGKVCLPCNVKKKSLKQRLVKFWSLLGPGLVTGASDDDPSGIATYTQAGAGFGFSTLWTAWITFPLMAAIQEMCARIGAVTGNGLTNALKKHYPRPVLYMMLVFSFPAITLNIGADLQGMGAVSNLLIPAIPARIFSIGYTAFLMWLIIKYPYQRIAGILKWLCLSLLLYIAVPFMERQPWLEIARNAVLPDITLNKEFFAVLVGILGTTISPYLFFWQANMTAEDIAHKQKAVVVDKRIIREVKMDVDFGILFSNVVFFFIMLTAGAVLHKAGIFQVDTVDQAAKALEPLTGKLSYLFFALGVIGTGLLAIPVLSGSLSYILAETFEWEEGLDKTFTEAKGFYLTMITALLLGLSLDFLHVSPMKALLYTAILYGLTAPILILMILSLCNNKAVMGKYVNGRKSNILGGLTFLLMALAGIALLYFQFT
jgi:NRAMP (natural resistance-associated macrophage protein)-like metal ion transporter